jgi:hypothetical protein
MCPSDAVIRVPAKEPYNRKELKQSTSSVIGKALVKPVPSRGYLLRHGEGKQVT